MIHTDTGALAIGPVNVKVPYFTARLTYEPSPDDDTLMLPVAQTGIAWNLASQTPAVNNFEISAQIADDYPSSPSKAAIPGTTMRCR